MRGVPPLRSSDYGRRGQPGRPSAGLSASELICRRIPGRRAIEYKPSGGAALRSSADTPPRWQVAGLPQWLGLALNRPPLYRWAAKVSLGSEMADPARPRSHRAVLLARF